MITFLFLSVWTGFLVLMGFGTWILFRQLNSPSVSCRNQICSSPAGVSILKPLKGVDADLERNLESFFLLSSACPFELLFSVESEKDPAWAVAQMLCERYPQVPSRIFIREKWTREDFGFNPKIQNLEQSFLACHYDLLFISDSNVKIRAHELNHLVSLMDEKTGMVTSLVSGVEFQGIGGALESVFLGTFYGRFMALSNLYFKPLVVGKCMLFRKSTLLRFGGIKTLSSFLAEDFMAGEGIRKLGLRVKTSSIPVLQVLGKYSFQTFWKRHLRWGRIRKSHSPLTFVIEPFFQSPVVSAFGAFALHAHFSIPFAAAYLVSMGFLCILDGLSYWKMTPSSILFIPAFPFVWLLREVLALPLWWCIFRSNQIEWRGKQFTLAPGGLLGEK